MNKICHLLHVPFTGLGLFQGFRGNVFLKNRIKIFKQFVISSLQQQTNKNFVLWCAFRHEEKTNPLIKELQEYMATIKEFKTVFTFAGICFYDDKYPDEIARERLVNSVHGSIGSLLDVIGECDSVLMTIQPSDDCYHRNAIEAIQKGFEENPQLEAIGFSKGYICNYLTREVKNYNPQTNPPFYTVKFPREVFIDPLRHIAFTKLKQDVNQYKAGTPLPSHEYPVYVFGKNYGIINERGFCVGCHGENVSTGFNIPYAGEFVSDEVLRDFAINDKIKIDIGLKRKLLYKLPHKIRRKIRYWQEKRQI